VAQKEKFLIQPALPKGEGEVMDPRFLGHLGWLGPFALWIYVMLAGGLIEDIHRLFSGRG
jgi:hypothetical protein